MAHFRLWKVALRLTFWEQIGQESFQNQRFSELIGAYRIGASRDNLRAPQAQRVRLTIPCRHPLGPRSPPPPGRTTPPPGIFKKKSSPPPPGASDSPFPSPEQKKIKISETSTKTAVCQRPIFLWFSLGFRGNPHCTPPPDRHPQYLGSCRAGTEAA